VRICFDKPLLKLLPRHLQPAEENLKSASNTVESTTAKNVSALDLPQLR
jgi:hypothetical protein